MTTAGAGLFGEVKNMYMDTSCSLEYKVREHALFVVRDEGAPAQDTVSKRVLLIIAVKRTPAARRVVELLDNSTASLLERRIRHEHCSGAGDQLLHVHVREAELDARDRVVDVPQGLTPTSEVDRKDVQNVVDEVRRRSPAVGRLYLRRVGPIQEAASAGAKAGEEPGGIGDAWAAAGVAVALAPGASLVSGLIKSAARRALSSFKVLRTGVVSTEHKTHADYTYERCGPEIQTRSVGPSGPRGRGRALLSRGLNC